MEVLLDQRHLLACDVCRTLVPTALTTIDELDGAPCMLTHAATAACNGTGTDNFYRRLYESAEMKRVVARKHTSLLPDNVRLGYRGAFKRGGTDPQAPNVLVATPTLGNGHRHRRPVHRDARVATAIGVVLSAAGQPCRTAHRQLAGPGLPRPRPRRAPRSFSNRSR